MNWINILSMMKLMRKRIEICCDKIKGHVTLWCESVKDEKKKNNKPVIKSWDKMVENMRGKFLPKDYKITLYKKM